MRAPVLIVEDTPEQRYLLRTVLESAGYTVLETTAGDEALDAARRMPPALVVSDVLMPRMDGFALCRAWHADPQLRHIPFLFYTSTYTEAEDERFALALGADRFLIKPQEPEVLLRVVAELLKQERPAEDAAPAMPEREYWQFHDHALGKKLQSKMALLEDTLRRLSASEARYRSMFESNSAVMLLTDPADGCIVDANPAALRYYGEGREQFLARRMGDIELPGAQGREPGGLPGMGADLRRSRHRLCSGEVRDVELHSGPVSVDGRALVYSIVHDVTERRRAEEQARRHLERLEAAVMSTIETVRLMSELRDPYTSAHEQRVSDLAAGVALEMGLSSEQARQIRVIGLVHDIGKISIPAEILLRPGPLTALEFELVKHHAERGYEILKRVEFQWPVAEVIRQHHERLDGSGYPRGLRGESILLEARIIAVADVVESMSMHRPYRPGWGLDAALEEISSGAGTVYDARAVQACLTLFRERGYQLPS